MYQFFYKLNKEKQKRIMNAAIHIFSINDFKNASTDVIASEAKIAKDSLFQYFKNKKSLYIFLYEYALKILAKKANEKFNFEETDYFEILRQSLKLKMALLERYPYLYQFVIKANSEKMPEIVKLVVDMNQKIESKIYGQIFEKVDYSKFKEGTDIQKLTKMIYWCSEAICNEGINNHLSVSEMYEQVIDIYDFYKNAVYNKEYL